MPFYQVNGEIPSKRHTVFRKPDNSLYHEELVGTEGFSGSSSLVYHLYPPTQVKEILASESIEPKVSVSNTVKAMRFSTFQFFPEKDYLQSRKTLFFNQDMAISTATPTEAMDSYFFKNADADELIFIHEGKGVFKSMYGNINFEYGDYIVIPRGTVYQLSFESENNRMLITESYSPIRTPKRYRNDEGQLLEHAPFCERDFKLPVFQKPIDQLGDFVIKIKKKNVIHTCVYQSHPFDLVGWDGCNYPYAFSIFNFEPITGRIHMPPPIHQTFEGNGFVICSFVPRLYDYHPNAIPAPYHHSNIDSDELLYYVDGDFMSRNDIKKGNITYHPAGVPHGPHPGAIERSIGKKETNELAVMIDPFAPLNVTDFAMQIEEKDYHKSWIK
jgi:homogentisate 1,2-dioxygenase